MKKTIAIGSLIIVLALVLVGIYWFKRGDACLAQPPFYNCRVQDKFDAIDAALSGLSSQTGSEPEVMHIGAHADIFSFEHIAGDGGVGWTRIMRNGGIKDSLGFYTNDIDPVLTPLSEDTLIGSAWQWPQDSKLYNGPFFNYYLDFRSRQTTEFPTKGKLVAASPNGAAAVFLESECDKNPPSMEIGHNCNNQNLSLRLLGAPPKDDGVFSAD